MSAERPLYKCHDEPMRKNGRERGAQRWRCAVKDRERDRRRYVPHPLTPEQRSERSRKANQSLTYEQIRDRGRKGGMVQCERSIERYTDLLAKLVARDPEVMDAYVWRGRAA